MITDKVSEVERKKQLKVTLSPAAQRQIEKIPDKFQNAVFRKLDMLAINPVPYDAKRLVGVDGLYRIRMSDYRIIYTIDNQKLLVLVVKIGHRKDVYRNL